jgi:hypothetical protein
LEISLHSTAPSSEFTGELRGYGDERPLVAAADQATQNNSYLFETTLDISSRNRQLAIVFAKIAPFLPDYSQIEQDSECENGRNNGLF